MCVPVARKLEQRSPQARSLPLWSHEEILNICNRCAVGDDATQCNQTIPRPPRRDPLRTGHRAYERVDVVGVARPTDRLVEGSQLRDREIGSYAQRRLGRERATEQRIVPPLGRPEARVADVARELFEAVRLVERDRALPRVASRSASIQLTFPYATTRPELSATQVLSCPRSIEARTLASTSEATPPLRSTSMGAISAESPGCARRTSIARGSRLPAAGSKGSYLDISSV